MNIEKIIREKRGTIVDVRTPAEFSGGHVAGSINIPIQEIDRRIDELRRLPSPLILCCASGGRSAQAYAYLSQKGITCYNGGSWLAVNNLRAKALSS